MKREEGWCASEGQGRRRLIRQWQAAGRRVIRQPAHAHDDDDGASVSGRRAMGDGAWPARSWGELELGAP